MFRPLVLALLVLVASAPVRAQSDFGATGPEVVDVRANTTIALAQPAVSLRADLYLPRVTGPRPVVVLAHGFGSEKVVWGALGRHLASWGFVAVAPSLPSPLAPDHEKNGRIVGALLDTWIPAQHATAGSPLEGRVDVEKTGAVGHSAGGLATLLALAARPGTVGVMLDWVDARGLGAAAVPVVADPAAFLFAEPSACNSTGNGASPSAGVLGPTMRLRVNAANHCDPIDSAAFACALSCGGPDADRQKRFRAYTTAWLRRFLFDDRATDPYLGGSVFEADRSAGRIEDTAIARLPADAPDAGPIDAGPIDAGPIDAGPIDAGPVDAGPVDAGPVDAGPVDAGPVDAGSSGSDAGGPVPPRPDAGEASVDAGTDAGTTAADAGERGSDDEAPADGGCACGSGAGAIALAALFVRRRRR